MPVDDRFTIRSYRDGDEAAILDLFARSFHAPRSHEQWAWKFERDPYGAHRISLAFDETVSLVGHYAGYPIAFVDEGRERIANQIGDTMTDVAVRHVGRGPSGILGRTALHFYATFCEQHVAFNYGFNVANIQRFSLRFLRSDRVESVTYRVLPKSRIRPISRWARIPRGYQLELVTEVGEEWDRFFDRVAGAYRFLARRDAGYVRWRYLESPDRPHVIVAIRKWRRLVGWVVFRIRDERFTWGDALFDPRHPEAIEVLLRHVVPSYPISYVEGWFPPRPRWFSDALDRLGFEVRPEPQDLSLMCVPFLQTDAVARMREGLYYTWGDSDLF